MELKNASVQELWDALCDKLEEEGKLFHCTFMDAHYAGNDNWHHELHVANDVGYSKTVLVRSTKPHAHVVYDGQLKGESYEIQPCSGE